MAPPRYIGLSPPPRSRLGSYHQVVARRTHHCCSDPSSGGWLRADIAAALHARREPRDIDSRRRRDIAPRVDRRRRGRPPAARALVLLDLARGGPGLRPGDRFCSCPQGRAAPQALEAAATEPSDAHARRRSPCQPSLPIPASGVHGDVVHRASARLPRRRAWRGTSPDAPECVSHSRAIGGCFPRDQWCL
jgi:hypothetical protein